MNLASIIRMAFVGSALFCCSVFAVAPSVTDVFRTLKQSAMEHSPEVTAARSNVRAKNAHAYTSLTRWLPKLELQIADTSAKDYRILTGGQLPTSFSGFSPQPIHLHSWQVQGSLPIYRRSVHLALRQADDEKQLAEILFHRQVGDLDWRLRELFGNYLLQAYKVATVASSIDAARSALKETLARISLGQRTRLDLLRAQANLSSLDSKALASEQQKAADHDALLEYSGSTDEEMEQLGLPEALDHEVSVAAMIEDFARVESHLAKLGPFLGADDGAARATLERISAGPGLRAIVAEAAIARSQAGGIMAQDWPDISMTAQLQKQNLDWTALLQGGNTSYSFGVVLTIPLFLGGSLFSSASEKNELEKSAEIKKAKEAQRLRHEVLGQRLRIRALRKTVDAFALGSAQNEELVRLGQKTYDLGKSTVVELLDSQNNWVEAKTNLAKAKIDLNVLLFRFAANLGVEL